MGRRVALAWGMVIAGMAAVPAPAQFFLKSHPFEGQPVRGDEPGVIGQPVERHASHSPGAVVDRKQEPVRRQE